jgi:hypothetical protein
LLWPFIKIAFPENLPNGRVTPLQERESVVLGLRGVKGVFFLSFCFLVKVELVGEFELGGVHYLNDTNESSCREKITE